MHLHYSILLSGIFLNAFISGICTFDWNLEPHPLKSLSLVFSFITFLAVAQKPFYDIKAIDSLYKTGQYVAAMKVNTEYLTSAESAGECQQLPLALFKAGEISDMLKRSVEALYYFHRSLKKAKLCNDESARWLTTRYLGGYYYSPPTKDSAHFYLNTAYQMIKDKNMPREISSVTGMLGETWSKLFMNEQEGLRYYKISVAYAEKSGNYHPKGYAYFRYGAYLVYHRNCVDGVRYLEKSYQLFMQANDTEGQLWLMKSLSEIYQYCGNMDAAYKISRRLIAKQDSVFSAENLRQAAQYQALYETEKKERENLQLQEANRLTVVELEAETKLRKSITWFFALSIIMLTFIFILLYRQYNQKKKMEWVKKLESERGRISRELHDNIGTQMSQLSSSLDWLQNPLKPISENEKKDIIQKSHQTSKELIHDLREAIWALKKNRVTFIEVADKLKTRIKNLSGIANPFTISYSESIDDSTLNPEEALDVLRICQEAAHNALLHSQGSELKIKFHANKKGYQIQIADNGKGIDSAATEAGHYGFENMKERAQEMGALLTIHSEAGSGTTITVSK